MKRVLAGLDRMQQRHARIATTVAVFKRFGEHGGGRLSTTIAYWGFFSIFPLLLVFVTVLDIVVRGRPEMRQDLLDGAIGQVPVIGTQLAQSQEGIQGSWTTVGVGVAAALWSGLAVANALQVALDEIWDVPMYRRPNGVMQRLRALLFLVAVGVSVGVSTTATNVAAIFELGILAEVLGHALAFAVNAAVLLFTYWLLTTGPNAARELLPGAVAGGVGLMILQIAGNWLMERHIKGASDTYGTFAVVIALLSWFFLVSRIVLLSAELNSVLARRLSPRSIVHEAGLTDADRRAAELDAHRVQRDDRLDVEVEPAPPASATT